jgi:WD40 repeat protein
VTSKRPCVASVCVLNLTTPGGDVSTGGFASAISSCEVSPCLRFMACGRSDGSISLNRYSRDALLHSRFQAPLPAAPPLATRKLVGHSGPVFSTAFSRESRYLLSAGQDGCVRLWSVRHAVCLVQYRSHGYPVNHVAFSPHNSQFLTACYDGGLRIFTTERRAPLRVLAGHLSDVTHAIFHPNGAYALSASEDGTLRLWDIGAGACIRLLQGHTAPVRAVAISPDGATATSAAEDGTVRLWHLASSRLLKTLNSGDRSACAISFSTTGRLLASVGGHSVSIWEVRELIGTADSVVPPSLSLTSPVPLIGATFIPGQPVLIACGAEGAYAHPGTEDD